MKYYKRSADNADGEPPFPGSLVKERDSWREKVLRGEDLPTAKVVLDAYKSWRGSESDRSSRMVEQLCEMVLVYREQLEELGVYADIKR